MKRTEKCKECGLPVEKDIEGLQVPCSEYHIRCIRCGWPVAMSRMGEDKICDICKRTAI